MKINTIERSALGNNALQNDYSAYRSLEKALEVLGLFVIFPVLTVTEISKKLGYPKSTISGLLKTFCKYEIVEKGKDNAFRLGIKAFELGFRYLNGMEIHTVARLWAERLSQEEHEPIHIAIRRGTNIYIILDVQPPSSYMAILQTGMNIPAHATALGKVLMAQLTDKELAPFLEMPLERLTEHTIVDPGALKAELFTIKQAGYAIDREESLHGLVCISAPVFQSDGHVIAAISISSMELLGKEERIQTLIQKVKQVANNVSMDIGYRPVRTQDSRLKIQNSNIGIQDSKFKIQN
jgi:IclR family acetate operon transcriptional repressor